MRCSKDRRPQQGAEIRHSVERFCLSSNIASAHDETRTVQITGKVVEWRFVNPHSYLIVEVTTDGRTEQWDFSFGGAAVSHLKRQGYTAQSFKAGEIINARGNPARSQSSRGILVRGGITRQDGTPIP
jgi:hypothetical protein